ncbi:MAG: precorrin-2 C(20)-methyltransferase [Bacteroides sp.]|nr:precorrin-2 C(20)-methyltransferase [Bacteroides sp.]
MSKKTIHIVSLGPGDVELISDKGKTTLLGADVIFCPETKSGSRAKSMLIDMGVNADHIQTYMLAMSKDRTKAFEAYDIVVDKTAILSSQGKKVCLVAEGDAGFYSSTSYMKSRLSELQYNVVQIAGIPAFIAASAFIGIPVTEQDEQLIVTPGVIYEDDIRKVKEGRAVVVVMKISQCEQQIKQLLREDNRLVFHYVENATTEKQYYTTDREEIESREFPYFALMIIKRSTK